MPNRLAHAEIILNAPAAATKWQRISIGVPPIAPLW